MCCQCFIPSLLVDKANSVIVFFARGKKNTRRNETIFKNRECFLFVCNGKIENDVSI